MASSTTKVQIANLALQKLGVSRKLESLTQDHANARAMNLAFNPVRDAELRRHPWSFAIKRASIAEDGDSPTWGDWNQYTLPGDFLRLLRDDETGIATDWKIEGLFVLSADTAPLQFRYIARIEDPSYYDALFVEAFACALAKQTCEEITQSTSKLDRIQAQYDEAIAEAKRIGAFEKPAEEAPEDDWVTARL